MEPYICHLYIKKRVFLIVHVSRLLRITLSEKYSIYYIYILNTPFKGFPRGTNQRTLRIEPLFLKVELRKASDESQALHVASPISGTLHSLLYEVYRSSPCTLNPIQ